MKKFKLIVQHNEWPASKNYYRSAESALEAINSWQADHPSTQVLEVIEVLDFREPSEQIKHRTPLQIRAHHKARITQMRNNAISLLEDEETVLSQEERIQLSRVTCQLDRILALWATRTMDLKLSDLK